MNELTHHLTTLMRPTAALIVYKLTDRESERACFAEVRPIYENGCMGEGVPVTRAFIDSLSSEFPNVEGIPHGMIPDNMLFCDPRPGLTSMCWYNPPQQRMMYFDEGLCIEDGTYHVPGILYLATEQSLHVFAYTDRIPTRRTRLMHAPFFNVYRSGRVCLGDTVLEKPVNPTYQDLMDYWESKFWKSVFVCLIDGTGPVDGNLVFVTKAAKDAPFAEEVLIETGYTLEKLLK